MLSCLFKIFDRFVKNLRKVSKHILKMFFQILYTSFLAGSF